MCLAVFIHRPGNEDAFVVYETRDQSIHLRQGRMVTASGESYGCHWRDDPGLLRRVWTMRFGRDEALLGQQVRGGLDAGGGTWVAVNEDTGLYAKILIAPTVSGELGESPSTELRQQRAKAGYVTRSGLCLDAVSYPSAAEAIAGLRALPATLAAEGRRMLPFFLLVADAEHAYVVQHHDQDDIEVHPVTPNEVHVLSVRGLDAPQATLTGLIHERLAGLPAPGADPVSWDPWLATFGLAGYLDERSYQDPAWRAHRMTALQPPYLNTTDETRHRRAPWPVDVDPGEVEWTKSTTCAVLGRRRVRALLYEERHVEPGEPWPTAIADLSFPRTSSDYTAVVTPVPA
ncbi:hypothetical protein EV385_2727 [Krasilnikovia cinnamomea]|uniref:Transport and Golgi organization protein 2 n=1 Tax=Krasilnikovia cinnamomea TaxID=349313 RepID=A0A4Q7ZKX5_9ACTN|nr:hypothetical protein [Krasilnikovia cinnamomea]RZU50935.1 hypothetical protein EV385_2727 [Krasilnikovia cinnamomea]